jgi:hypothetical protein
MTTGLVRSAQRRSQLRPAGWQLAAIVCLFSLTAIVVPVNVLAQTPVYKSDRYTVWPDRVEEGNYSAHAASRTEIDSTYPATGIGAPDAKKWTLKQSIALYPQTHSEYPLVDALYNLSLEEMVQDLRPDGAFNAGAKWQGVWTRDVSYSILLSLAAVQPDAAKASLLHKVKRDRIVQDTGTGGSWPISSDRVTWALAAWEVYLVTGERAWLEQSYTVIRNSILDDQKVVIDPETGLARGESSFLDWREQTYPRWMEPADIYSAKALGTNAVYYRVYRILAAMAKELGHPVEDWDARAERIRGAVNARFWVAAEGKTGGYFGQYLYGRESASLSPRAEALGESLTILFDIADPARQDEILRSQPLMEYGIPTVYPQTPNIPPYHNRSVWPFVQAYWNLAAAKRGNEVALTAGMASIYRESALFLTNKENFVLETGSALGTEINSDRQLWSVAANLAMTYRVLFGMRFELDGLHFAPVVPETLKGARSLTNFHYREALLSIEVKGFGDKVRSFTLDGKPAPALASANLSGAHTIVIQMADNRSKAGPINKVKDSVAPESPVASLHENKLTWAALDDVAAYRVYRDGKRVAETHDLEFTLPRNERVQDERVQDKRFAEYQVSAVNAEGTESFLSAPVVTGPAPIVLAARTDHAAVESGDSFLTLDREHALLIEGSVPANGRYSLSFRYANGSGPVNTENKCAIRTLYVDDKEVGPVVLPQRGMNDWTSFGVSSQQVMELNEGKHRFELRMMPWDENMNGDVNRALVVSLTILPLN